MMKRISVLAVLSLSVIGFVAQRPSAAEAVTKPSSARSAEVRLAHMGPILTDFRPSPSLRGEFTPMQVEDWVARALVVNSAGYGPEPPLGTFGGTISASGHGVFREIPPGAPVADLIPVRNAEGRTLMFAPDGQVRTILSAGQKPMPVELVYGPGAIPRPAPSYRTLLDQPELRVEMEEVKGPSVHKDTRRFAFAVSVRMAVPTTPDAEEGPIDVVYAKRVSINVPKSPPDDGSGSWDGDPDLNTAMSLALPKALHDFAVRVGAARLHVNPNGDYVGVPYVGKAGQAAARAEILREAARPLTGWRASAALP